VRRIVEHADATAQERTIGEINTSIYCFRQSVLAPALRRLSPRNAQGEYYLPDVLEVLSEAGYPVAAVVAEDPQEIVGVNDRVQLAAAEAELRARTNLDWMSRGVTMLDPQRTYIDTTVELAPDVTLFPGTLLQGETSVGAGSEVGPDTRLVDTRVGERSILEKTMARDAVVGDDCRVGPFAVLEPGSEVRSGTRTGSFYTADIPGDHA
jgi:bifunctional UDP-N-acetylglucosamine pyrophosphorylase / glucosamine-1-phosphate N-acetyltransferase